MSEIVRNAVVRRTGPGTAGEWLLDREWLVANGLGGYASGTVGGVPTRRYHGLLIAALPAPHGRVVLLTHLSEQFRLANGTTLRFGGEERIGGRLDLYGADFLREFRLEDGLPVWAYDLGGSTVEKRVFLPHGQNTAVVTYALVSGPPVRVKLRPAVQFRPHDAPVNLAPAGTFRVSVTEDKVEITDGGTIPPLKMKVVGERTAFTVEGRRLEELLYRIEESRGYDAAGQLYAPGYFRADLTADRPVALVATAEPWDAIGSLTPAQMHAAEQQRRSRLLAAAGAAADDPLGAELVLAADQFVIRPAGRAADSARARAEGDEACSVIAGYHWFTDWGRDTMISLEGLTLLTGRHREAGQILRTFAAHVRDGLVPNYFPEGTTEGVYHTADASLWFVHAVGRYLDATGDRGALGDLLPVVCEVVDHHARGTRFGIGVDHDDGLLRQGADGYQLTWMDAKMGDWVVTPRRGKAVEINALWYNALRLAEGWLRSAGDGRKAGEYGGLARRAYESFNRRFWNPASGCLFDVVDGEEGDDPAVRPNQVFAVSLPHAVLDERHWKAVVEAARTQLLTPVGLRSLAPGHKDYKARYSGDLLARDGAYHQGTVWAWLIGPYVDAWLRVHPGDRAGARAALSGFDAHLGEACVGTISEVFDAEGPFTPRGCAAQAWSVAEVLRAHVRPGASG